MTTLHTPFRLMTCLAVAAISLAVVPWATSPAAVPPAAPPDLPATAFGAGPEQPIVPPPPITAGTWPAKVLASTQPPTDLVAPTPFDSLIPPPPVVAVPPARKPLEGPIRLNFKDASLHSVLEYLSSAAGLVVVETVPVESRISIMSAQPLSIDETVALLNTILKEKGYAAVRTGRTLKIVALTDAKKAAIPVTYGGDPLKIEPSDQVVTHIIPVQFADATQLKTNLTTLLPAYADLQANTVTNVLILTATQTDVRRIVEIVHALDTQMASVSEIKVFQLQYASATSAATLITNLFKTDNSTTGGGGTRFGGGGGGGRGGPGGGGPGGGGPGGGPGGIAAMLFGGGGSTTDTTTARQPKVTAQADDRTNSLVVSAPADILKIIEGVVEKLNANPTADRAVFTYRLKNADATNIAAVLNSIFSAVNGSSFQPSTSSTSSRNLGTNSLATSSSLLSSGLGSSSSSRGSMGSSSGIGGFGTTSSTSANRNTSTAANRGTTGTTGFSGGRGLSSSSQQTAADLSGQVFVVAETDTNSLLVMTGSNNFPKVKAILDELDRARPQVLIKVLIAEVSHENTQDLGLEVSAINLATSAGPGFKVGTNFNVVSQTQGLVFSLVEDHITAALHALEGVSKVDVLSRPYILTSDNQQASIMVGQSVPIPTGSIISDTGQTTTSFVYNNVGIILTVTPHINPDGLVIMDVQPQVSSVSTVTSTVEISPGVFAPVFDMRTASCEVGIRDGNTIVIGGLMQDRNDDHVDKVPFLGDLPGIGPLFQHIKKDKTKVELLIFLTPHVAKVPEDLAGMSAGEMSGTKVIKGAVEPGAFEDQIKGMRQGGASPADDGKPPIAIPKESDDTNPR